MQDTTIAIGSLVAKRPAAARVLERHGIDFCCGGWASLADACGAKGIDAGEILEEITREEAAPARATQAPADLPTAELIEHIVRDYHRPLDTELPRLCGLARKVQGAHGPKDPERFAALTAAVEDLTDTLAEHMALEEDTVFPALQAVRGDARELAHTLEDDHREVGERLREIRKLTSDFVLPAGACQSWAALWQGLLALESALHEHIHLENNVLFPRVALGGAPT